MGCFRIFWAIVLPPVAVIDKGCGAILVVTILTFLGWIPGMVAALVYNSGPQRT